MTKTYYMFFIKKMYYNILDGQRLPFGDETFKYLYAYTDDKKLYKSFKKSRDMNKFKIVIKSVESDFRKFESYERSFMNKHECELYIAHQTNIFHQNPAEKNSKFIASLWLNSNNAPKFSTTTWREVGVKK